MCLVIFIVTIQHFSVVSAELDDNVKAAFIRNNNLWIKIGKGEIEITDGIHENFRNGLLMEIGLPYRRINNR